jgi:hypothetical protein
MDNELNGKNQNRNRYRVALWILLFLGILVLAYLAPTLTRPEYYSSDDFFPYWAAGKILLSRQNPYDPQLKENLQIKLSGHGSDRYPIAIMLNPPWAVTLVMPFGVVNYPTGRLIWLVFSIGCIVFRTNWRSTMAPLDEMDPLGGRSALCPGNISSRSWPNISLDPAGCHFISLLHHFIKK